MLQANLNPIKYATRERTTTNESMGKYYEQVLETQYTAAADGETNVVLTIPVGARIIQIEREIKPMYVADWSYNPVSRDLTLLNGNSLVTGETLFITYSIIITA